MFADLFNTHYDSFHPDYSHTLVNSVRSYINSKLDHERKTREFITELRRRLYFIHEYNCQVAKVSNKYPRSRKFDLLLIKYVELEFDVLYNNNPHPSRQLEITTELRVLRLLQVMLYPAVLKNEPLVNENTDGVLKRAVLQLLGEVRSTYFVKNKLVCNIANQILRKIDGTSNDFNFRSDWEVPKNLATSDYGTDDSDSDFENDIFYKKLSNSNERISSVDCVEVPVTTNGVAAIPTVEFTDDDNYFVYLQKGGPTKRKIRDDCRTVCRKRNFLDPPKEEQNQAEVEDTSCVIICSDSEDEGDGTDDKAASNKNAEKNLGVVTFEILDDDDDQTNYMVYLQKEVATNKTKKQKVADSKEIVICSDSEDESEEIEQNKEITLENIVPVDSETNSLVVVLCVEAEIASKSDNFEHSIDTIRSQSRSVVSDEQQEDSSNPKFPKESLEKVIVDTNNLLLTEESPKIDDNQLITKNGTINEEFNLQMTPSDDKVAPVNTNFLLFDNAAENVNENFLVDPTVIFEQITETQLPKNGALVKFDSSMNVDGDSTPVAEELGPEVLGGPVLGEKGEDFDNVQDCRINDSLLEELLLDDGYLLEGRKEFEELEYFLFNESTDKQGFYLSNFSFDDGETVSQPETFDADIKSLESFLDDSQLLDVKSKFADLCENRSIQKNKKLSGIFLKDANKNQNFGESSNSISNASWKNTKRVPCAKDRNYKTVFKQSKKLNKR